MMQTQHRTPPHPSISRYLYEHAQLPEKLLTPEQLQTWSNHVVVGDAVEVLAKLPDSCVDLVHTSPPYNIDKPYESSASDKNSIGDYVEFLQRSITQLKRVVRPGGSIFWQTGYTQNGEESRDIIPIDLLSYEIFREHPDKFLLWDRIIWRYWGGHAFTKKFTNKHETIMWYVKPGAEPTFEADAVRERAKEYDKRNNFWGRNPGNVWEVDRVAFGATKQTSHIAVFPEEIAERIIRACSEPGDLVLDPFAGSGTVPKVAHGLGRRWLGIEISPVYANEAAVRIGFQQPSESDSLASELIKQLGFGGTKGIVAISDVDRKMEVLVNRMLVSEAHTAFEEDVRAVFADGNGRNNFKREVWNKYDTLLSGARNPKNDLIVLADRLLLNCYKLRRQFNGVTRYKSALSALQEVLKQLGEELSISYVQRIADQEPSSFKAIDSELILHSSQRAVGAFSDDKQQFDEPPRDSHEGNPQGRMLL